MDADVPYLASISNLSKILDKIQNAGVPEVFNRDFLNDLGFTSSNDRSFPKVLKYLGFIDSSGRPQGPYREFVDHTKARKVLAGRLRHAYDDLFLSDKSAQTQSAGALKGWFKTKTGTGDAAAEKMATTFKALAQYADFSGPLPGATSVPAPETHAPSAESTDDRRSEEDRRTAGRRTDDMSLRSSSFGFVYRLEIHLPDTQNVETFRAIFRALREEML